MEMKNKTQQKSKMISETQIDKLKSDKIIINIEQLDVGHSLNSHFNPPISTFRH